MEQSRFSISDLSKEFGVTTRTIRFYEDKGLLNPAREGQKRIYGPGDRTRLKLIIRGKRIGLSLDQSAEIIKLYNSETDNRKQLKKLLHAIEKQKNIISERKSAILAMEKEIQSVEDKCLKALASSKT